MSLPKSTAPFLFGAVAGAAVLSALSIGNNWVVSTQAKNIEVQDAWYEAQAAVCAARATAYREKTNSTVDLAGYTPDAREARNELAQKYAVALPGQDGPDPLVVTECSQMLNEAA
ncbi:MAG TPA: hypothetical protein DCG48_08280 [Rhodospirillaceae bacterium]|nr:hypothetical protein [Rhodospirillaceae bacterium]|tara:strand:+ start:1528 stop:1872 length:345 start_codon:yes stop_codon:yes gene_type:complete